MKFHLAFFLPLLLMVLGGCHRNTPSSTADTSMSDSDVMHDAETMIANSPLLDSPVTHDVRFKVVKVQTRIEDFNALGFAFGDSVDAVFNTGFRLDDIPYYNGFYVETGAPMIVGYPGSTFLYLGYNDGDDVWDKAGLDDRSTVSIYLHEKEKYISVQNTFSLVYSDNRQDYPSDIAFANYRAMSGGKMKKNIFYRSASPVDNRHQRAPFVDALIKNDHIQYVLNFSDSEETVNEYLTDTSFSTPYYEQLYRENRVFLLDLSSNYRLDKYKKKVAESLIKLLDFEPPYLAHCVEGKDRTGFISILMEGLCGAGYDELKYDYMKTYEIYYGVSPENRRESYDAIVSLLFDGMINYLAETKDIDVMKSLDYRAPVISYLKEGGMSDDQIQTLTGRICESDK